MSVVTHSPYINQPKYTLILVYLGQNLLDDQERS